MVFFAEPPSDTTEPRYVIAEDDAELASIFGGGFRVIDTWTRVCTSSHPTPPEAIGRCDEVMREQELADAAARATGRVEPPTVTDNR